MPAHKHRDEIPKYGLWWNALIHPIQIEIEMIRRGGRFQKKDRTWVGEGLFHHYKQLETLLWPEKEWHKWNLMQLELWLKHRTVVVLGAASTGKTHSAATDHLADYYCFPDCTTVLCCSTTVPRLEDRVWGEIKKYHKLARSRHEWIPGHLTEGKLRITTDSRFDSEDGRDFRNGLIGVAVLRGETYVGIGNFVGIKNKRVRLLGDELSLLPRAFIDAISNLDANPDFKATGLGNPKDITDALGVLGEPAVHLGGWEGDIDQGPGTKTWATKRPDGICIQLPGSDSPNLDGKMRIPLITQEKIDRDIAMYGMDSMQYTMMNEGRMPKGQGSRRVITRQKCLKFGALEEPIWVDQNITKIGGLDAAYGLTGGDRTIFCEVQFGKGIDKNGNQHNQIALVHIGLVPVNAAIDEPPEDQIAAYVKQQCELRNIPPDNMFFDSTGRGSLMAAFARLEGWRGAGVQCVEFGGKPSERQVSDNIKILCRDYYSKFVSELWFSVAFAITSSQFRGMTEEVMREGCMREWRLIGGKTEVETKEDMKKKTGRSPDLFDSLAVAVEGARRKGFVIQNATKVMPQTDEVWKDKLRAKARALHESSALNYSV